LAVYRIFEYTITRQMASMRLMTCASDEEAIEQAKTMLDGRDLEVRQGFRIVIRLQSKDK
jgi:hypothetical protein